VPDAIFLGKALLAARWPSGVLTRAGRDDTFFVASQAGRERDEKLDNREQRIYLKSYRYQAKKL
jgi:hypothetical protein